MPMELAVAAGGFRKAVRGDVDKFAAFSGEAEGSVLLPRSSVARLAVEPQLNVFPESGGDLLRQVCDRRCETSLRGAEG